MGVIQNAPWPDEKRMNSLWELLVLTFIKRKVASKPSSHEGIQSRVPQFCSPLRSNLHSKSNLRMPFPSSPTGGIRESKKRPRDLGQSEHVENWIIDASWSNKNGFLQTNKQLLNPNNVMLALQTSSVSRNHADGNGIRGRPQQQIILWHIT